MKRAPARIKQGRPLRFFVSEVEVNAADDDLGASVDQFEASV